MFLIFTTPNCYICEQNKKILKQNNIEYQEINITQNKENIKLAKKYGVKMGGTIVNADIGEKVNIEKLIK